MFKRMNTGRAGFFVIALTAMMAALVGESRGQTEAPPAGQSTTLSAWQLASSCKINDAGGMISTAAYRPVGWMPVTVPSTVLAAQLAAGALNGLIPANSASKAFDPYFGMNLRAIPGTTYPVGTFFSNQEVPADSPYACGWWYRGEFKTERGGGRTWLRFAGINYSGEIWINGQKIAGRERVAGAYRRYEFDVTEWVRPGGQNVVAVETFAPGAKNLGINWVDWNPCPADKNMGLWGAVTVVRSGAVTVRSPMVATHFTDDSLHAADLTVRAIVANATAEPVSGTLRGSVTGLRKVVQLSEPVTLAAHETKEIELSPKDAAGLHVESPEVWWPYGLGGQHLNTITLSFVADGAVSDAASARFGIRETSGELDAEGHRLFRINRHPILIRGGGWSPDMLLREAPERLREQFKLVRDLHLNTIRLEGKLETEQFFDLADEQGVLVMAGWCCCDHWEHWKDWTDEDLTIATDSLRGQMLRLRSHASLLVWLNGSDGPPPDRVENAYLAVEKETHWPNALLSSASATATVPTGKSGVKMLGPYDYVVPSYWLRDTQKAGGAYGFNTETSPGPAVPDIAELKRFLPADKLWPINPTWDYHTGGGKYKSLDVINLAMDNIYGPAENLATYVQSAEAMEYDAERAMFEAYGRNKYHATGVVQWMLNNAWPSLIWHLYDYYLQPGAGYYGAKKANEPLHVQYSYDDGSVVVVNGTFAAVHQLRVKAVLLDTAGKTLFKDEKSLDAAADSATRSLVIPADLRASGLRFVRLTLNNEAGSVVSTNTYWLSNKQTEFDWAKTDYTHTPPTSFEDLTALRAMAKAKLTARMLPAKMDEAVRLELHNPSDNIAFQLALASFKADGKPYDSLLWSDNFVELLPGETRTLTATALRPGTVHDLHKVTITGWNVAPVDVERSSGTK